MSTTCPSCGATFEDDTPVCRKCFFVIDHARWNEDAGSPGADADDRAKDLQDAPIGEVPAGGPKGGLAWSGFRTGFNSFLRGGRRR
ncbi:MAG TPA: hypothetical protein VEG40_04015 [Gaiellaceae bacterium]|nr:hypothetical protein [Gaiellaceae bacterium]